MDVCTKVNLMKAYGNYWDMLPTEIRQYILRLRENQLRYELRQNDPWQRMLREIQLYARLKERWGLGHIKCIPVKKICDECKSHHVRTFGLYVDRNNVKRRRFLGSTILGALCADIHHIKTTYVFPRM